MSQNEFTIKNGVLKITPEQLLVSYNRFWLVFMMLVIVIFPVNFVVNLIDFYKTGQWWHMVPGLLFLLLGISFVHDLRSKLAVRNLKINEIEYVKIKHSSFAGGYILKIKVLNSTTKKLFLGADAYTADSVSRALEANSVDVRWV